MKIMKNLENYGTLLLTNKELVSIDGGDFWDWLDKNWHDIKQTFTEAYNKVMDKCDCKIANDPNLQHK